MIMITGGIGFIGLNFVYNWCKNNKEEIIILDKMIYKNSGLNIKKLEQFNNIHIVKGDICDEKLISESLYKYQPRALINFAAQTHVDTSIKVPKIFLETNVIGTFNLLSNSLSYWQKMSAVNQDKFKFIHISTDEVYGSLSKNSKSFSESSKYFPNNPYSASKASSDHFVRSYNKTYSLPTIISNCSNNYGAFQNSEKLIPSVIKSCMEEKSIRVYGNGSNIRDWLYVSDHCQAIMLLLEKGITGKNYNIGGNQELSNIDIISIICKKMDKIIPRKNGLSYKNLINFVDDRLGHDFRYSINSEKIKDELGWKPVIDLNEGIDLTLSWYMQNEEWSALDI